MTLETARKQRARRIASDEAHAWARSVPLNNPYGKTVLRALTLYVNGEGSCFVGIDQLADDTDLSIDTVRRRLVWLERVGAIVRLPQWLDPNGRRNSEGRGKRTTDDIRLLIEADLDEIERNAKGEGPSSEPEDATISPSRENDAENLSPQLAPRQPSQSCDHLTSEPEPEDSPQPPSGGSVDHEDWKEFEKDWSEPILRQSLARQVWAALTPEERNLARSAARGYVAHRKAQKKPPNVVGAQVFLRERDAWDGYAKRDPGARVGITGIAADSPEGTALRRLYGVARAALFENQNRIVYPGEVTPQMLAFADAAFPDRAAWLWIEDRQRIAAWGNFLAEHIRGARPPLLVTRGVGVDQRSGLYAPWPWPPRKDGTLSATGPPESLMSEQDIADFK